MSDAKAKQVTLVPLKTTVHTHTVRLSHYGIPFTVRVRVMYTPLPDGSVVFQDEVDVL